MSERNGLLTHFGDGRNDRGFRQGCVELLDGLMSEDYFEAFTK